MQRVFRHADSISFPTSASGIECLGEFETIKKDYAVRYVAGIAVGEFGVLDSSLSNRLADSICARSMSNSLGEWIAVAELTKGEERSYLVFGDAYGYAPLFYSLIPGQRVVISDTFNGVVGDLVERGISCHLNMDNYVSTLASWRTQFASPRPNTTMAEEIEILPLDKALLIDSSGVTEIPRAAIGALDPALSYEELLLQGNEFVKKAIMEVGALTEVSKGLLLSGGVDSRLVLSLIVASGMKDSFELRTSDPRDYSNLYTRRIYERDAEIANEIRSHYGMKWMAKSDIQTIPVSFRESLMSYQSYHSNFAYNFQPSKRLTFIGAPIITLRGGGGEILRSTSTGWGVDASVGNEKRIQGQSVDHQFSWWYMNSANWSNVFDDRICDFIRKSFNELSGESLVEKLNNYYLNTRNRSHFGHARASRAHNEIPLQFLSNAYYLEASQKISFQEKANGRMVADIFSMTTPHLLDFPFESPEWHSRLASPGTRAEVRDPHSWVDEFDSLRKVRKKSKTTSVWEPRGRGENSDFNVEEAADSYLRASFQLIEEFTRENDLSLFHKQIWSGLKADKLKIGSLISKVASAVDVFFPSVPKGTSISLETSGTSIVRTFSSVAVTAPTLVHDGWNNISVPDIQPRLHLSGKRIALDAHPSLASESGISYAFYLYRGDERVETRWYGPDSKVVFESQAQAGQYHGRVFLKLPHLRKPVLIRETKPVVFVPDNIG